MNHKEDYDTYSLHIKEAVDIVEQQYGLEYLNSMTLLDVQWTAGKLWARGYKVDRKL